MPKSPSLSVLFFDTKMFCNLMSRCKMLLTQRRTAVGWPHHTVASDSLSTVGKAECAVTNTAKPADPWNNSVATLAQCCVVDES